MASVETALRKAKGVKSAKINFEKQEAVVSYDPKETNPRKLVAVVANARGMDRYRATIKRK